MLLHDYDDLPIYGQVHADALYETPSPEPCNCEWICPLCETDQECNLFPAVFLGAGLSALLLLIIYLAGMIIKALVLG